MKPNTTFTDILNGMATGLFMSGCFFLLVAGLVFVIKGLSSCVVW